LLEFILRRSTIQTGFSLLICRRLVSDHQKHHAIHLAELARVTSANPISLLQTYKKAKAAGFPDSLQYPSSLGASSSDAVGPEVSKFDTFEDIERRINTDQGSDIAASGQSSGLFGGKAAKFKV
jgi:hypothetical protein